MRHALIALLIGLLLVLSVGVANADSLWLGNDNNNVQATHVDTSGNVLGSFIAPVTGFAWDGTYLYSGDAFTGIVDRRLADGTFVSAFPGPTGILGEEDMAYDPSRLSLWRVNHFPATLQQFDTSGNLLNTYALPTTGFGFTNLGAIGLAYDSRRDELYVSFCEAGCATFSKGDVVAFDPATGNTIGELFAYSGPNTIIGGLAYDAINDELWLGGVTVRHTDLSGNILSSFSSINFSDGLEVLQTVPEPATVVLLSAGTLMLGAIELRRRRRIAPPPAWSSKES